MKGLVLAGGHGTRLRPLTFSGNKHMIPIANQPILFYGLRHLARAGIRDVAIVLGPIQEGIRETIGDGSAFGLNVEYIVQGDPRGLADAVICAKEFLEKDPFLMYLGDNLLQSGVEPFIARFEADRPDAVVGATPVTRPESYGVIELAGGKIASIEEKPAHPKSNLALIGVYLFTGSIHPIVSQLRPSKRGELEITEAIWNLWQANHRVSVIRVDGWWKDTGRPGDLLEANELVLGSMPPSSFLNEATFETGAVVDPRVGIGRGSTVDGGSSLVGPTVVGTDVRISRGSHVGPNCAIGNSVSIVSSVVTRSIVMEGTRLEGVHIADSLIGRNVEIRSKEPSSKPVVVTIGDSSKVIL